MGTINFDSVEENDIILACQKGDAMAMEYILNKYKNYVRKRAREFFIVGGDTDDLIQEGMIGLYKAITDYDVKKDTSFLTFASMCINRQLITAVDASNCKKHIPLNSSISLDATVMGDNGDGSILVDTISNKYGESLEDRFIDQETVDSINVAIAKVLSKLEQQVFALYMEGYSYVQIAKTLNKTPKSIDNALQRIKNKVLKVL